MSAEKDQNQNVCLQRKTRTKSIIHGNQLNVWNSNHSYGVITVTFLYTGDSYAPKCIIAMYNYQFILSASLST